MAILGTPHRIVYAARGLAVGLVGVSARIKRPNQTEVILALAPMSGADFAGLYYADLITTEDQPAGEWIGVVVSPQEGIRSPFRVSFEAPAGSAGSSELAAMIAALLARDNAVAVRGEVEDGENLEAWIDDRSEPRAIIENAAELVGLAPEPT